MLSYRETINEQDSVMDAWWQNVLLWFERWAGRTSTFFRKLFEPVIFVGNRDRVRKPDEPDKDEERLIELHRTWRDMLREDPWMHKLMTHVRLLLWVGGIFWLAFFIGGQILPAKHPLLPWLIAGGCATIPYWLWIAGWNKKIEHRVFEAFKKKFGKHFHLK